jgi:propionyl-CoA synthetase
MTGNAAMDAAAGYDATIADWRRDPEGYWAAAARGIDWDTPPARIFDPSLGVYGRWFPGGQLNTCHNAVDRHVAAGRGLQPAIIWDSPMTGRVETITYADLLDRVARLAGALAARGVAKGDRVIVYMPMVPEAAIAMLACARLGAVHSVVFGGFAAAELATRIADATPKAIVTASCGLEPGRVVAYKPLIDAAIGLSPHKPDAVLILQRAEHPCALTPGRDADLELAAMDAAAPHPCVPVEATDTLYILYTSGTTGKPEGRGARQWRPRRRAAQLDVPVYGVGPGDVFWAASDVGWVVGHSYIVYAPLLPAARLCCSRASRSARPMPAPSGASRAAWREGAVHRADRVPRHQEGGPGRRADRRLRPVSTGRAVPRRRALRPGHRHLGQQPARQAGRRPLVADRDGLADHRQPRGLGLLPVEAGSPRQAGAGLRRRRCWTRRTGQSRPGHDRLHRAFKLPLPPSCLPTLWNADDRFREATSTAFPGYYSTADAGLTSTRTATSG